MTVVVDARFAGGHLEVCRSELIDTPVVMLSAPGYELGLRPDEARNLADALTTAAAEVEGDVRMLRRPAAVDELIVGLDG